MEHLELPNNLTRTNVEEYLRVRAPIPAECDPKAASKIAAKLIGLIAPIFEGPRTGANSKRSFDDRQVFRLMRDVWLPRCPSLEDFDGEEFDLLHLSMIARRKFEQRADEEDAERAARLRRDELEEQSQIRRESARAEYEAEERRVHAEEVKKLIAGLECGIRHAQALLKDGVTEPATARKMAEILGTKPSDHFRKKLKTGREPDLSRMFMKRAVDGCRFCDFLEDYAADSMLVKALRRLYRTDVEMPDHFVSLEQLLEYARPHGIDLEEAWNLWHEFILWMMGAIYARADIQYRERNRLADYDFG